MDIVETLKALADENRLRILNILKNNKFCVCEIEKILNLNQSNVSRHLAKLKSVGLIKSKKESQWTYFSLDKKTIKEYKFIEKIIKENLNEEIFEKDKKNIEKSLEKNICEI